MKKALLVILSVLMVAGLCACGSSNSSDSNTDGAAVSAPTSGAGGYVFEAKGVNVEIDSKMEEILDALGEPKSYFEAESCAFGEMDKVYTYSGFRIDTYQIGGVDYVSDVIFTDDTVSTAEGLTIGDSADKAKEIYGTPVSEDDSRLVFENGNMKLVCLLDGSTVKTIEYMTKILDE
ncbi:MAG: hypothetical protein IKF90_07210 [Parasporobacterium sp.]|nr:hypothetical protein [Parasporobacterium sp.]